VVEEQRANSMSGWRRGFGEEWIIWFRAIPEMSDEGNKRITKSPILEVFKISQHVWLEDVVAKYVYP
jgi:hypothetical protein